VGVDSVEPWLEFEVFKFEAGAGLETWILGLPPGSWGHSPHRCGSSRGVGRDSDDPWLETQVWGGPLETGHL